MSQPQRLALQSNFTADQGGLKNVSLITTGIEAAGHGIYLDEQTAEGTMKKLLGRSVKSYMKHLGAGGDRLGQEVGFFSGIYRQGAQIKASAFEFLDSFKKDSASIADKLIEMAQKVPEQFGVSLVLEYALVWVMGDGSELPAAKGEAAPRGALRNVPSMRVLDVISADFVGRPAANPNGLLSVPVDDKGHGQPSTTTNMSQTLTLSQSDHEAKIAELSTTHTTALAAKDGEIVALQAKLTEANAAKDALTSALAAKETEHKAALEKAVTDATAPLSDKIKDLETFDARKLGVAPLKVRQAQAAQADLSTPEAKLKFYEKIEDRAERTDFRNENWAELQAAQAARDLSAKA